MGRLQGLLAAEQILARENEALRQREQFKAQQDAEARRQNIGLMQFNANKDLEQQRLGLSAQAQEAQLQRQSIADARQAEADRRAQELYANYTVPQEQLKLAQLRDKADPTNEANAVMQSVATMTGSRLYDVKDAGKVQSLLADGTKKIFTVPNAPSFVIVDSNFDIKSAMEGKNPKMEQPLAPSKYILSIDTADGKARANVALSKMQKAGMIKGKVKDYLNPSKPNELSYTEEAGNALDEYNQVAEELAQNNRNVTTELVLQTMKERLNQSAPSEKQTDPMDAKIPQLDEDFIAKVKALPDSDPRKAVALRKINASKTASK